MYVYISLSKATGGIFIHQENTFNFGDVLLGSSSTVRFKISNVSKVSVNANLQLRYVASSCVAAHHKKKDKESTMLPVEGFEMDPTICELEPYGYTLVNCTFKPTTLRVRQITST